MPTDSGNARRAKKRWGPSLFAAAAALAVVAGLVTFGWWHDRQNETATQEDMLVEVVAQCDTMYGVLTSERSLEEQAEALRALGVGEIQPYSYAQAERDEALEIECGEVMDRSRDVIRRQDERDELKDAADDNDEETSVPNESEVETESDTSTLEAEADRLALFYGYTLAQSAPGEGAALAELTCERALEGWDYDTAVADDISVGAPQEAAVGWNTFVYEEFCPATT